MESSGYKRRFPPPWTVERPNNETYLVRDANGIPIAWVYNRDDTQKYHFGHSKLTAEEARRIASAIARLPEFLMQRQGFHIRGSGYRWKQNRPYHVAIEDSYMRAHWDEISALCRLNSIPFNLTGEKIRSDGLWNVCEFTWQMDAILFWDQFKCRWLRESEFHYPEKPKNLPEMKPLKNWPKFDPRQAR